VTEGFEVALWRRPTNGEALTEAISGFRVQNKPTVASAWTACVITPVVDPTATNHRVKVYISGMEY
jgi:hypothetical protein